MNFIGFCLVAIITFVITQFAATQVIGVIIYKLPKKQYNTIIGLIIWILVLVGYYFIITKWFNNYFNVYLWVSIIGLIISIINLKNLREDN